MTGSKGPLYKSTRLMLFLVLLLILLYVGQTVLVPICIAGLVAMLFLPVSRWLQNQGVSRGLAALLCVFVFLAAVSIIIILLQWQVRGLAKDVSGIRDRITDFISEVRRYLSDTLGISEQRQNEFLNRQQSAGTAGVMSVMNGMIGSMLSVFINGLLVVVYIFLFLYYRGHLKNFILKIAAPADRPNARQVIEQSAGVAQSYLKGLALMICSLLVMYSIGFSLVGVKSPIFFAVLCGLLEIVPFVGNITGTLLTILAALVQGGDGHMVLGILIVYGTVQFLQTYILEPLVVGSEVNINPLTTIVGIVGGEAVWGVAGMILAIPLLGIARIICDHVEALHPYAYLIGEKKKKKSSVVLQKIKRLPVRRR